MRPQTNAKYHERSTSVNGHKLCSVFGQTQAFIKQKILNFIINFSIMNKSGKQIYVEWRKHFEEKNKGEKKNMSPLLMAFPNNFKWLRS